MKKTIVVLGGGFGGVYTAGYLEKLMTVMERKHTEIVIVTRDNDIVFQPLLPEVISGSVELNHVLSPIRRLARSARLYTREVEAIDLVNRTVKLSPGAKPMASMIHYDHLVIALGTRLDSSKIPGMQAYLRSFFENVQAGRGASALSLSVPPEAPFTASQRDWLRLHLAEWLSGQSSINS